MSLLLTLNIFHFTERIPLVSSVIQPVYPSGSTFRERWVGWGVYTCGAYIRDVNSTTSLGGIYSGRGVVRGVAYRDQVNGI